MPDPKNYLQVDDATRLLVEFEEDLKHRLADLDRLIHEGSSARTGEAYFRTRYICQSIEMARTALERVAPDIANLRDVWVALENSDPAALGTLSTWSFTSTNRR